MNFLGYVLGAAVLLFILNLPVVSEKDIVQRETAVLRTKLAEKAGPPSDVSFTWWLPENTQPGETVTVTVQARQRGHAVPVSCLLNGTRSVTRLNAAVLNWTAQAPGSAVMSCSAGGQTDMRLLPVGMI